MNIWEELKEFGVDHLKSTGRDTFETSLLGHVGWETISGELVGSIPPWLQSSANSYGMQIEAANFREGKYVLRLMGLQLPLRRGLSQIIQP